MCRSHHVAQTCTFQGSLIRQIPPNGVVIIVINIKPARRTLFCTALALPTNSPAASLASPASRCDKTTATPYMNTTMEICRITVTRVYTRPFVCSRKHTNPQPPLHTRTHCNSMLMATPKQWQKGCRAHPFSPIRRIRFQLNSASVPLR